MLSDEDHLLISERSFDNDRDVANFAYRLGIERASRAPDAAIRAVIERLVEALEQYAPRDRAITQDLIADARKLLEDATLAQPADDDEWLAEARKLIRALTIQPLEDGYLDSQLQQAANKEKLFAMVCTRPAREGFVSVPVEPPIEEVEAIIACLEDDAAMLRDEKSDCEIAANMVQAVALIRLLLAIPAADVDLIAAAKGDRK